MESPDRALNALNAESLVMRVDKVPAHGPDLELEEDEAFLHSGPLPAALHTAANISPVSDEVEDELQEDESFLNPINATSQASNSFLADPLAGQQIPAHDDEVLEEDPMFAAPSSSQVPSSPPFQTRLGSNNTSGGHEEAEGESLPSATQLIRSFTGRDIDVTNIDLGAHVDYRRQLKGTTFSGRKIYFGRQKGNALMGENINSEDKDPSALGKLAMGLLETPIHVLLDNLDKAQKAAEMKTIAALQNQELEASQSLLKKCADKKGKGKERENVRTGEIWTDKYKPRAFTDLLGDERTHRLAMSWLKEWDACVFKDSNSAAARRKSLKRAREAAASGPGSEGQHAEDPYGRPHDKILLLTGPPGLGKTTLAHVIAHQAGYQVAEVNASDDRTAKTVHDRIRNSLESRALTSLGTLSGNRPTCLVIDEIDGAAGGDAGFIRTLIKLVTDGSKTGHPKAFGTKGKAKRDSQPLLRPIICICNDLYTPALRPLRALARIVRFHAPTNAHLIKRVKAICDIEGLRADHKSLTTLVTVAEGDMRSCLNTLQIIRKQTDVLDEKVIKSTALGLKDTATSVTAVWDKLFKIPAKKRQKGIDSAQDGKYISRLIKDLTTCGEYDKLAQTCFENYLKGKSPADGVGAITKAMDWLLFYDQLDGRLRSDREYDLMPYMPYTFIPWNPLFAAVANKTPEWPRIDYETYLKRTAHQEIADTLRNALPLGIKELFTAPSVVSELAPLLMRILTPDLKPVNQQLVKSDDKAAIKKLVQIMLSLQVGFVQDKNEDGQVVYKLEPPLDVFVHYDGKRASDVPPARYNLRQLISRELEAETVRRSGGTADNGDGATSNTKRAAGDIISAYKKKANQDQPLVAKEGAAVDFFGRPIIVKAPVLAFAENEENEPVKAPPPKRARVSYKYHEGFSNAVRTNVKVFDLFR